MDVVCSLHALIACFTWSNLYIDSGLSLQDSALPHQVWEFQTSTIPGGTETVGTQFTTDKASNPYGRLAFGYELRFSKVTFALEASHTSSLDTNEDRGVNALNLKARWYPFR